MKLSKKSLKSSLFSGRKGVVVIQKTNLSRRKVLASNMAAARAALKGETRQSSPMSATTPPSVTSVSSASTNGTRSSSGMSSLTQESTRYKKHGVSFHDFIEDNKDWRSFNSITYEGMKVKGYIDILLKKISIYKTKQGYSMYSTKQVSQEEQKIITFEVQSLPMIMKKATTRLGD